MCIKNLDYHICTVYTLLIELYHIRDAMKTYIVIEKINQAAIPIILSYNSIKDKDALQFVEELKQASTFMRLSLSGSDIEIEGIKHIVSAIQKTSVPIKLLLLGNPAANQGSAYFKNAIEDNFAIEAGDNPGQFIDKIKSQVKFINQNVPIITLNVVHPIFSVDIVGKKITDFLGLLEIATINIKAIKEVGASVDNKYSSINYNMLNSMNHKLSIKFSEIGEEYENDNILKRVNQNIDFFLRKLLLPNKYQEMQSLANKYEIKIGIKNEGDFKNVYKKIALETHPDKTVTFNEELRAEMQEDFMKVNSLLKQDATTSLEIYKPIMDKLCKANLFIKVADTSIDIIKGLINPTLKSSLKISIDCIQLSAMYYDSYSVMLPITGIGALYQIYNADYEGAVKSVITSAGIIFMSTAIYATAPALSVVLTAGYTGYTGYAMLKNVCELYYEYQNIDLMNDLDHGII